MKNTILAVSVLSFAAVLSAGCATAVRGTTQSVKFVSEPTGAAVSVNGENHTTPFSTTLKRNQANKIVATAPGFRPIAFTLSGERDMMAVPQFVVPGGSALLATDVATGADKHYPGTVTIKFTEPAVGASDPVQMYQFEGAVLTKPDYDKAVEAYRQALANNHPANAKRPEQNRQ